MDLSRARWRKSSYSANGGGNCIEIARMDSIAAVRDSKNTTGPTLAFPTSTWHGFLTDLSR